MQLIFVAHVAAKAGIYSFISAFVLAAENKRPKWQILYISSYPDKDIKIITTNKEIKLQ